MTTTTELRPAVRLDHPKPPLTAGMAATERALANTVAADELVRAHLGPTPADPNAAYQQGLLMAAISRSLDDAENRGLGLRDVPELLPVYDYRPDANRPPDPADGGVIDPADYDQPSHGLQCLHCGTVAWDGGPSGIVVIDRGERRNEFTYEVERRVDDGAIVDDHAIVGGYGGGADMHTEAYACGACGRFVRLPAHVEEVGS